MTLQNAKSVFIAEGEEVSTGRRTIALNPEASVFEPPVPINPADPKNTETVNPFMNEDGLQSTSGDRVPTGEVPCSSSMIAGNHDMSSTETNALPTNTMTEGQMAEDSSLQVTEEQSAPMADSQEEITGEVPLTVEPVMERQELPQERINELVLEQVPFFFSRENWSSDPYLLSQMDSDQYVPIHVLASCSQFKNITKNHYSLMDALKKSELVQLDEEKNRIRPNYKRCIVILREIPEATPTDEIEHLFSHVGCPNVLSCEFINNDTWYVTFDNDDDAQKAYRHLREVVKTFKDKPIAARIKTKPITRQNCFAVLPPQPKPLIQPQTQQSNGNGQPPVVPTSAAQPTVSTPFMGSQRVYFPASNNPYNYYPSVSSQVQPTAPAFFYPSPMMQWPSPNGNFYDMNSFIHYNGLSPKATFKPSTTPARFPANTSNNAARGARTWPEHRSQSANSNATSGIRPSSAPRTNTAVTTSYSSSHGRNLGQIRPDGGFIASFMQNDQSGQQNMYGSYSPPVTTDIDSERSNDVSPLVSGDYATFLPTTPYEGQGAVAQIMPIPFNTAIPGYPAPVLYRNGYGNDQRQQQRNNIGSKRRPRGDEEFNNSHGRGRRSYNGESTSHRVFPDRRKPQFTLQSTSFPPLPGSDEATVETVVPEEPVETVSTAPWNDTHKFSDIMKGTTKPKSEKGDSMSTASPASVTSVNKTSQTGNSVEATSQAIHKPKPTPILNEAKQPDEGNVEQVHPIKTVQQARAQTSREPRTSRPDEKRLPRHRDTYNTSLPKGKKDTVKFGNGNKENRPSPVVRPNIKEEHNTEEGWNKVKGTKANIPLDKPVTDTGASSKRVFHLKPTKPLTNGDISPPPGISRSETESSKLRKEKITQAIVPGNNYADVQKEVEVANVRASASQGNSMSWAKMAKSGKDEMEKLSAVIKEKDEQERVKKNRSGARPPVKQTQEKVVPGKDAKPFRRDPKEKTAEARSADKNQTPAVREPRPRSPKAQ